MAFYQLTLEATMTAVWGQKPITDGPATHRQTSAVAVLLIPSGLLCLAAVLQSYVRAGMAGTFVAVVNGDFKIEMLRGTVFTAIVSIIAITSGGSAGPEVRTRDGYIQP